LQKSRRASNASPPPDLRKSLHTPLPPGPYASWPEESRVPALLTLRFQCAFIAGMGFAGPQVPHLSPAETRDAIHAVVSTCVVNAMPDDWPQRAAELEQARSYLEKTKGLFPASMDLEAIGKSLAEVIKRRGA
jgi:hypothetical protein